MKKEIETLIGKYLESYGYNVRDCLITDTFDELGEKEFIDCHVTITIRANKNK